MISRDEAKAMRQYIEEGGALYHGICKPGSYWIAQLHLEKIFTETAHGQSH